MFVFFFKQKTAYEMRISDWSSDVCSSDLALVIALREFALGHAILIDQHAPKSKPRHSALTIAETNKIGLASENLDRQFPAIFARHCALKIGRASCRERVCQYV